MVKKVKTLDKKFNIRNFYDIEAEENDEKLDNIEIKKQTDQEVSNENLRLYQKKLDQISSIRREKDRMMAEHFNRIAEQENYSEDEIRRVDQFREDTHSEDFEESEDAKRATLDRLPSSGDAKVWLVRTKPGKEFLVLRELARKLAAYPHTDNMPVHNVYCGAPGKGFVYAEAFREQAVGELIKDVSFVLNAPRKNTKTVFVQVPLDEVTQTFVTNRPILRAVVGDFVRLKGGVYNKDLAQVVATNSVKGIYEVRVVPRVSLDNKKPTPKKLLFEQEILRTFPDCKTRVSQADGLAYIFFKGKKFREGFLFLQVPAKRVEISDQEISMEESRLFSGQKTETEEVFVTAKPGDRVKVLSGELQNLEGSIKSVCRGTALLFVKESMPLLETPVSNLKRLFKAGDDVRIIAGTNKGAAGLVVGSEKNGKLEIYTGKETFYEKCSNVELTKTREKEEGNIALQKKESSLLYKLGTLLQSDDGTVCMMLGKSALNEVLVLTTGNEIAAYRSNELRSLPEQKRQISFDADGTKIKNKNTVCCCFGELDGLIGSVLFIFNEKLFVQAFNRKRSADNEGCERNKKVNTIDPDRIFVISSDHVRVNSGSTVKGVANMVVGEHGKLIPLEKAMLGKQVKIKKGPHKSHSGVVRFATNNEVVVELLGSGMKVRVNMDCLSTLTV